MNFVGHIYKSLTNITCPADAYCRLYSNLTSCNQALENVSCFLLNPCVLAKECVAVTSRLIQYVYGVGGIGGETGNTFPGPEEAMSIVRYIPAHVRIDHALIGQLPTALPEFYSAHFQVINAVALTTLGIGVGIGIGYVAWAQSKK